MSPRTLLRFSPLLLGLDASAATFNVNVSSDLSDVAPGNGVCSSFIADTCSLRAAIMEANALAGSDTIVLQPDTVYTLTQAGIDDTADDGDLDITSNMIVRSPILYTGNQPRIDANGNERVFHILQGNVTIADLELVGGDATIAGDAFGGAIGIEFDAGQVLLSFLRIHDNRANFGGGIYNDGPDTELMLSEINDNTHLSGPLNASGAGIYNRGTMRIEKSAVFGNVGANGAVEINTSAVVNTPPNVGVPSMTIINSTIADNIGQGLRTVDDGILALRNVTLAGNSTLGLRVQGSDGQVFVRNTIIAGNADADCMISVATMTLSTDRYNLDSDNSCGFDAGTSNLANTDPLLTPLDRQGGFTSVMLPQPGSPVLDAGHPSISTTIGCEAEDQRFVERPVDFDDNGSARCDIGAVELEAIALGDAVFADGFEE